MKYDLFSRYSWLRHKCSFIFNCLIVCLVVALCFVTSGCAANVPANSNTIPNSIIPTDYASTNPNNLELVEVQFSTGVGIAGSGETELIVQTNDMPTGKEVVQLGYTSVRVYPTVHTIPGTTYVIELDSDIGNLGNENVIWNTIDGDSNSITDEYGLMSDVQTIKFGAPRISPYINAINSQLGQPLANRAAPPQFSIKVYKSVSLPMVKQSTQVASPSVKQTIILPSATPNIQSTTTQISTLVTETTIQTSFTVGDVGDSTTWNTSQVRGQMWTVISHYRLSYINIFMRKVGQPGNITLIIKATNGNSPIGQAIANVEVSSNSIPLTNSWVRFNVSGIDMEPGQTYWWGVYAESGSSSSDYYAVRYNSQNGYQQGSMWNSSLGVSQPFIQYDDLFEIYGQMYE
jgi:hypothetical protein